MRVLGVQRIKFEDCKYLGWGVEEQATILRHPLKMCISITVASYGVWTRYQQNRSALHNSQIYQVSSLFGTGYESNGERDDT